jgi:ADP-ribose pyrophosphatase
MTDYLWTLLDKTLVASNRIFDLVTYRSISPDKKRTSDFYILETKDWVNVLPITPEGNVILVNQYRHGSRSMSLEIPGGIVEFSGEDRHLNAAKAELQEETGYASEEWEHIGKLSGNPALFTNWCNLYVAHNAKKLYNTSFDPDEFIEIHEYPLKELPQLIRKGLIYHPMVVAAIGLYFMNISTEQ